MNRRVMAVTAAAVMSMSGFAVPAMADEEEAVSIQISAPITSMDPLIGGDSTNVAVISNTMEGLFVVDADGQIQNGLCDSYEVSDDQKTYTFHIRDNAKWSDGTPVTAQDFEYAWKRNATAQGDYSKFTYQIEMAAIKNYVAVTSGEADADELGVTAVDDNTLQVELEYPVPFFLNLLTFSPWAPVKESKLTEEGDQFGVDKDSVLYCGAYTLDQWDVGGNTIVLKKNPDYWDADRVQLPGIKYQVVGSSDNALTAFKTGALDVVTISGNQVASASKDASLAKSLAVTGAGYMWYLSFSQTENNAQGGMLSNVNLRLAISNSIDREALVEGYVMDGSLATYTAVPPQFAASATTGADFSADQDAFADICGYNPEKAVEYFNAAVEELETDTFTFTMIYGNNEGDSVSKVAQATR